MGKVRAPRYVDEFGRVCPDCKEPLFLLYTGPLKHSQSMWKLTDKATEWLEKYTESGKMYDNEDSEEGTSSDDSLAEFILAVQDLDVLDVNTLPQRYYPEFEEAKNRGFFAFSGGSSKAGKYRIDCINKRCSGNSYRGNPSSKDPRGMTININDNGSQDKLRVIEESRVPKIGGSCPFDGSAVIESPVGLMCTECGRSFRLSKGVLKNELSEEE
jgi:uncharacterized protein YbaR (Trm112 family)